MTEAVKAQIRRERLELRSRIEGKDHQVRSSQIMQQLMVSDEYVTCKRVLAYMPTRAEVSTADLLFHVLDSGRALYLPRVRRDRRELEIVKVAGIPGDLCKSTFGILEPAKDLRAADNGEIRAIDLAVIPGLAFDSDGYRLGYGGGYFDHFLPRLDPRCVTVGVCFREQLVDKLPRDPWDKPVKRVIAG